MYTWRIWDEQSPVNGTPAEAVIKGLPQGAWGRIYLIECDGVTTDIQPESHCPYPGETFEDSARLHCEAKNAPVEQAGPEQKESEVE